LLPATRGNAIPFRPNLITGHIEMNLTSKRALVRIRRGATAAAAGLLLAGGTLFGLACLDTGPVETYNRDCSCSGIRCVNSVVGRATPSTDEYADPCKSCHITEIARCMDGCGPESQSPRIREECPAGYSCLAWNRVEPGAACQTDRDCEPGLVDGVETNTLACVSGRCTDAGAAKWGDEIPPARVCSGAPEHGAHPACEGAACVSDEPFGKRRFCSVARCVEDADCPPKWRCSCREEFGVEGMLKTHRWCVPDFEGGFPEGAIVPESDPEG
jgi:hypothetical protein